MKNTDKTRIEHNKNVKHDADAEYPGAAVDTGDKDKVNPQLVKERTCTLNNNPRNNEIDN